MQRRRCLGLDADHARLRVARLHRRRDPADQAAAADRHDHDVGAPRSSRISRPTVPWPAITAGSLNGCTSVRPVSREQDVEPVERLRRVERLLVDGGAVAARRRDLRLARLPPHDDERVEARLARRPGECLRVVAGGDRDDAARLLRVGQLRERLSAPRTLNEPVRWKSSSLRNASAPRRCESVAERLKPVRWTRPAIVRAARSTSSIEITRERLRASAWRAAR